MILPSLRVTRAFMFIPWVRSCCLLSLFGFVLAALPISESFAQQTPSNLPTWTIPGANFTYAPGEVPWALNTRCPFGIVADDSAPGKALYEAATLDAHGCPYA